jgi:shikimate kinase
MKPPGIVLIGMPGSGKTSVGAWLSNELKLPLLDSDAFLEQRKKISIKEWFQQAGEEDFRNHEYQLLQELQGHPECIILSTGGGMPLIPGASALIKNIGFSVFLDVPLELLSKRLSNPEERPLLDMNKQVPDYLKKLYEERHPKYLFMADIHLSVSSHETVESLAERIVHEYRLREKK